MIKIDYKNKTVDIYGMTGYTKEEPYYISFDRFRTGKQLIEWIEHLRCKNWFNEELELTLIKSFDEINGLV